MTVSIRLLYLDDCDIDHRLMQAYLSLDDKHSYHMTTCTTLEEARAALAQQEYDALILDNRVPPHANYHQAYTMLKEATGFDGCTMVISADVSGEEFKPEQRHGEEIILDKAELLAVIRTGVFADVIAQASTAPDSTNDNHHGY
jgi:CheY-like chemotaxis protein